MGCTQSSFYIDDKGQYWDCQNAISAADVPRDWAIKTQGYGAVNSWLKVKLPRYCYVTRVRLANSFFGVLKGEWKTHKIGISNHYVITIFLCLSLLFFCVFLCLSLLFFTAKAPVMFPVPHPVIALLKVLNQAACLV